MMIKKNYLVLIAKEIDIFLFFCGKRDLVCIIGTDLNLASYPGKCPILFFAPSLLVLRLPYHCRVTSYTCV